MEIKSRILIYWTGRGICTTHDSMSVTFRKDYLDRLKNIITDGFWMMPNKEKIMGYGGCINKTFQFCTCFTDLGVNNSAEHIKKYGLMGIGISREFILERDGRPVWYFLNDPTDIHAETVNKLFNYINSEKNGNDELTELYNRMSMLFDYAKPMGDNFSIFDNYYEEREWRVVWNSHIKNDKFHPTGIDTPKFLMPFKKEHLKLIIFPDVETKNMFYSDTFFQEIIDKGYNPSLISWEEFFQIMK
ncbi:MAG: abortive infection system antitoxin AbiGi family protein [Bacteroidota bacterium]